MARHRHENALEDAPLRLLRGRDEETTEDADVEATEVEDAGEVDEPEEYGLRVNWQSEAVKIEAAEFLVATRVQQDARIRAAHDLELLRHPDER